jgi:hypothetical protein
LKFGAENWTEGLFENPIIFKLDYDRMKKKMEPFVEELNEKIFNPDRISRLSKIYNFNFKDWTDIM